MGREAGELEALWRGVCLCLLRVRARLEVSSAWPVVVDLALETVSGADGAYQKAEAEYLPSTGF